MIADIQSMAFAAAVSFVSFSIVTDGVKSTLPRDEPTTDRFFEVASVVAHRDGDTATLDVDRTIKRPFAMSFSVRVMEGVDGGWREFCAMQGPVIEYRPESVLPDPVTLDWWTWGQCATLPDGAAQIWTTWTPADDLLAPVSVVAEVTE